MIDNKLKLKPRLLLVSAGPKTGSSLLADMFATATDSSVRENLMCADMFEAGMNSWCSLSLKEQVDSQTAFGFFKEALDNLSLNLFMENTIAKTTSLSHVDHLKYCLPGVKYLFITRDWQSSAKSLYGFIKHSSVTSKFQNTLTAEDCIRYVRARHFRIKSQLTKNSIVISYADIIEMSNSKESRHQKFSQWQEIFPFLNIDLKRIDSFVVDTRLYENRKGLRLLETNELKEVNQLIEHYENKDKLRRLDASRVSDNAVSVL